MAQFLRTPYLVVPLIFLACATTISGQPAAPQAPVTAAGSKAKLPPFDLTYVPIRRPGLIGFRPSEMAMALSGPLVAAEVHDALETFIRHMFEAAMECDLSAAEAPGFEDIEQCICRPQFKMRLASENDEGGTWYGLGTPFLLRTARPYDWANLLQKWFPGAEKKRRAGRKYFRVALKSEARKLFEHGDTIALPEHIYAAAYIPDERTIVFGFEAEIRELLDRLNTGNPGRSPPPGWKQFERDVIALAIDTRKAPLVTGQWPQGDEESPVIQTLFEGPQVLAAGMNFGSRTEFKLRLRASDVDAAGQLAAALQIVLHHFRAEAAHATRKTDFPEAQELVRKALKKARVTRDGCVARLHMGVSGNLLDALAPALRQASAPPLPVVEDAALDPPPLDDAEESSQGAEDAPASPPALPTANVGTGACLPPPPPVDMDDAAKPAEIALPPAAKETNAATKEKGFEVSDDPPGLTLANYKRIIGGMTIEQVEAILGPSFSQWPVGANIRCTWYDANHTALVHVHFRRVRGPNSEWELNRGPYTVIGWMQMGLK